MSILSLVRCMARIINKSFFKGFILSLFSLITYVDWIQSDQYIKKNIYYKIFLTLLNFLTKLQKSAIFTFTYSHKHGDLFYSVIFFTTRPGLQHSSNCKNGNITWNCIGCPYKLGECEWRVVYTNVYNLAVYSALWVCYC